jgi:hypothetical protein
MAKMKKKKQKLLAYWFATAGVLRLDDLLQAVEEAWLK